MQITSEKVSSRIITIRLPHTLDQQLATIAERDANTVSGTVRRLIRLGIRTESRQLEAEQ